ncbi:MAG: hypothetical protein EOP48_01980 [Sphingobacteriales bacterium]|nr:MAG: hypothetical protein EOP48_01980 [Sphingobacteriales bacterium]
MRNHLEKLTEIDKLLADNGFECERQELELEIRASSTGGEICARRSSKLLKLQDTNKQIDQTVGHLIKEFISYCHHNGLYPKSNYES